MLMVTCNGALRVAENNSTNKNSIKFDKSKKGVYHAVNGKLAGVTSKGKGCAREGYPGVYTRVAYFIPWINNNVDPPGGLLP